MNVQKSYYLNGRKLLFSVNITNYDDPRKERNGANVDEKNIINTFKIGSMYWGIKIIKSADFDSFKGYPRFWGDNERKRSSYEKRCEKCLEGFCRRIEVRPHYKIACFRFHGPWTWRWLVIEQKYFDKNSDNELSYS